MEEKPWFVLISLLAVVIFIVACVDKPTQEELDWKEANRAFTVKSFTHYLEMYPNGTHAAETKANIAALQEAEKQSSRVIKGTVKNIDESSRILTIKTSMGDKEVLRLTDETVIEEKGTNKPQSDLRTGEGLRIEYINLPDGTLLAGEISIGYTVSHCSCGSGCPCPLSKGCRTIRY